jgi:hypothetical protein
LATLSLFPTKSTTMQMQEASSVASSI